MNSQALEAIFHEGMMNIATVGGPLLGALLVVGLVLGVLQSATQIQEPAVGAVPRLATAVGVAVTMGPWIVQRLAEFLHHAIERLADRTF